MFSTTTLTYDLHAVPMPVIDLADLLMHIRRNIEGGHYTCGGLCGHGPLADIDVTNAAAFLRINPWPTDRNPQPQ